MPTKPSARTTGLRIAVLALVAALVVAVMALLACATASPSSQQRTPAPKPSAIAKPTSTQVQSPTPLPTYSRHGKLDDTLSALTYVSNMRPDSAGAQSAASQSFQVIISAVDSEARPGLMEFLKERGVTSAGLVPEPAPGVTGIATSIRAEAPLPVLKELAERSDVARIKIRPNFDENNVLRRSGLEDTVILYEAGLMPEEDENPNYALLFIYLEKDANLEENYESLETFLEENGAILSDDEEYRDKYDKPRGDLEALVPVRLFGALDDQLGIVDIEMISFPLSQQWVDDLLKMIEEYSGTPESGDGPRGGG